jgi:hypothetical protein
MHAPAVLREAERHAQAANNPLRQGDCIQSPGDIVLARSNHVDLAAARAAFLRIARANLIAELDREFGPPLPLSPDGNPGSDPPAGKARFARMDDCFSPLQRVG